MNFYLTALNEKIRTDDEAASIGMHIKNFYLLRR